MLNLQGRSRRLIWPPRLVRPVRPASGLDGLPARADLGDHRADDLDPHAVGDLDLELRVVRRLRDLADDAAGRHHRVAPPHVLDQLLMLLHPPLLRPDDQEPHDHKDEQKWDELENNVAASASAPEEPLRESGGDQALSSMRDGARAGRFSRTRRLEPFEAARTIAGGRAKSTNSSLDPNGRADRESEGGTACSSRAPVTAAPCASRSRRTRRCRICAATARFAAKPRAAAG